MEENLDLTLSATCLAIGIDNGKFRMPLHVVSDNDGVFKCVIKCNPKMNTKPTLTVHVRALRELLDKG
eukprot:12890383-Prorocentrum_lima.AAC.1